MESTVPVHLLPRILLNIVIIPICFAIPQFGKVVRRQLHYFSNASTMGYGQCTYIKQINEHGKLCCSFVIGKARVTPLKIIIYSTSGTYGIASLYKYK